jgi:hypothetical protein
MFGITLPANMKVNAALEGLFKAEAEHEPPFQKAAGKKSVREIARATSAAPRSVARGNLHRASRVPASRHLVRGPRRSAAGIRRKVCVAPASA